MDNLYTTESAAVYLGVSPSRVRQLILEQRIESQKVGRDHLISGCVLALYRETGRRRPGRKPKK